MANIGTMRQSLVDMITRLQSILNTDGSFMFQTVSVWNDQVNTLMNGKGKSYLTPACFIEVTDFSDGLEGAGIATQDVYVAFHIIDTQLDAMDGSMEQNLKVFDLRTAVRKSMTSYNPSNFGSLMFCRERQDFKHGNIYHLITTFKAQYRDFSGNRQTNGTLVFIPAGSWHINQSENIVSTLENRGIGYDKIGENFQIG